MSLVYSHINPKYGSTVVWKVDEKADYFLNNLRCEIPEEHSKSEKRSLEWACSRYIIQKWQGSSPNEIFKDEYGKPHLINKQKQISISHSNGYAAVIFNDQPIGIDIQTYVSKIYRIESKFTTYEEIEKFDSLADKNQILHIIWTIKESVFKLYGRKELPFIEGILINSVKREKSVIITEGLIRKNDVEKTFRTISRIEERYCLSVASY